MKIKTEKNNEKEEQTAKGGERGNETGKGRKNDKQRKEGKVKKGNFYGTALEGNNI